MEMRTFGRSGMKFSLLGFGCGSVGGLMVRGDPADQERTVARALEAGVNYFDTAAQYGNGESEKNLGRVLNKLKPTGIFVGTKVRVPPNSDNVADAVAKSLEDSLRRLAREQVDLLQLHNGITTTGKGDSLRPQQVLNEVIPAFETLRHQGKVRFLGITAVGDTPALHEVIDAGVFDSAQVCYNMLNPSAGASIGADYPAQDYGRLFDHTVKAGMGTIAIRVLAGGALSGSAEHHPIAAPARNPIGTAKSFDGDLARAKRLAPLVAEGFATSLVEAATRFCITHAAVGTVLVGMASPQEFEDALAAVEKGPLPTAALDRLAALQQGFFGEAR